MTQITKTFTYNLADDYLAQTSDLGKTAEWTYIGPDMVYLVIDGATNRYMGRFYLDEHDGHSIPLPEGQYMAHVDCESNPLLCCLAHTETEKPDYADLDQHEELLPDGLHYRRPLHPPPDHTHDINDVEFDPVAKTAHLPYPWKKPHSTWEDIRRWRNAILAGTDGKEGDHLDDMPEALKQKWVDFRQHLRDIPQTHGGENTHIFIDLTAEAPLNTVGHYVIKLTEVTGINIGDDVGVKGFPKPELFGDHTKVVGIDATALTVELSKPLVATASEHNVEIAFSPQPETDPWKIGAHTAPNGEHGPLDKNGNVQEVLVVGNLPPKRW